jgi:pyoverdine/dityrosine biosynthesis protein Dit1
LGERANDNLFSIAGLLGLKRVIVADYDCINKYAANCLSIEISLNSKLNNSEFWYEQIFKLSKLVSFEKKPNIQKYRFVYRITNEDRDKYKLTDKKLIAFKRLDASLAKNLGVASPAYPIFVNDKFTPYNYGGVLNKIE